MGDGPTKIGLLERTAWGRGGQCGKGPFATCWKEKSTLLTDCGIAQIGQTT